MTSFFLWPFLAASLTATGAPAPDAVSAAPCETGIFRKDQTRFVAVTKGGKGYGYTFSDGVVGNTLDAGALLACGKDVVLVRGTERWP